MKRDFQSRFPQAGDGAEGRINRDFSDDFVPCRGEFELIALRENIPATGYSEDWLRKHGEWLVEDRNLVVTVGRRIMSRLIAGAVNSPTITLVGSPDPTITAPSELFITKMKFGTGGNDAGDPTLAVAPLVTDEALYDPIASPAEKAVTIDYPTDLSVRFAATLEKTEANGEGLSEEGLFTDNDLLFARKTFGIITKSSDFTFLFRHTILF